MRYSSMCKHGTMAGTSPQVVTVQVRSFIGWDSTNLTCRFSGLRRGKYYGHKMMIRQYINVFKLRIGFVIALAALGGVAITPGSSLPLWKILVLFLTVMMGSAAAGAFNQYSERDIDAKMMRTKNRPFVVGFFQHSRKWLAVIGLLLLVAVTSAAFVLNTMTALNIFIGAFTSAIVYTVWLKRRTWLNIVFSGLAGGFHALHGGTRRHPSTRP